MATPVRLSDEHDDGGGGAAVLAYSEAGLVYPDGTVALLDGRFSALDAQLRTVMHTELLRLHRSTGATFVLVTHDLGEAVTLADRVIVMTHRPARILHEEEIGLPRPRDPITSPRDPAYHDHVRSLWDRLQGQLSAEHRGDGTA